MAKPCIQVEGVTKSFGDRILYRSLDMSLSEGQRVALVAKNGAGKTTLLRIIAGKESADSGQVILRSDLRVAFLEQEPWLPEDGNVLDAVYNSDNDTARIVKRYEQAVLSDDKPEIEKLISQMESVSGWDYEYRAKAILTRLQIYKLDLRIGSLSGGQRKRVALAQTLIDDPDVLILDEPTNHLDLEMVEWLEEFLVKRGKTLLMVTHDRYFLDRICTDIYELDQSKLFSYTGGYAEYLLKREERIALFNTGVDKARNLFRHELEWMRRMPQARGTKAKYRKDAFYQIKETASQKRDDASVGMGVRASRLGTKIFETKLLNKKYGEKTILHDFSYIFSRYEKVGIVGANGTGKTTFLNILTGIIPPDSGTVDIGSSVRFGYYRQQGISFDEGKKVIEVASEIAETVTMGNGSTITASQFLNNFLFPPEVQYQQVAKLSGGERRRLYLLTILMQNPNFLILDEPTNDLDIMTLNVLEQYLLDFEGCVLIVSHDRYFMDKVADKLLIFDAQGIIRTFPGNYTQYRNSLELRDEQQTAQLPAKTETPRRAAERTRKISFREKQEMDLLDTEIQNLETEKKSIEDLLASGTLDNKELLNKSQSISRIMELLDEKSMRWLELSELG